MKGFLARCLIFAILFPTLFIPFIPWGVTEIAASEEPQAPVLEEPQVPVLEEPQVPVLEEPQASALEEPQVPVLEEPQASALEEPQASALEEPQMAALVLKGATLYTVTNGIVPNGILVVQDGKIVAVGPSSEVTVPDGAVVRDVSGKVILPGLVDTHSHLGVYPHPRVPANADGNETTGPVQSVVRALDAIYPSDPGIRMAQAGGITTANIMPGSGKCGWRPNRLCEAAWPHD